jgi:hypothetical protein
MTTGDIPDRFVWTKIQADAGQSVDRILRRKELERQLGGTFWWGIGQAPMAEKISQLGPDPDVILSLMRSVAHSRDSDPDSVLLWDQYIVPGTRKIVPVPAHAVVISRAHDQTGKLKSSYHALVCAGGIPHHSAGGAVNTAMLRNIGGRPIGSSQITAVVECISDSQVTSRNYPITARANLVAPGAVRLTTPRLLSDRERRLLDEVSADGKTVKDWIIVARQLRRAGASERQPAPESDCRHTTSAIPRHIGPAATSPRPLD